MTKKERMQLPAGMALLFTGMMLKRFGGETWPVLAVQIAAYCGAIFFNIRYMLKLRAERSGTGGE